MLDARRSTVLQTIVEEYVATGQPVGSATVVRRCGLGVSSATVRNDMAQLEAQGYILQPHTSAGRVPSDRGYRYYVDNYAQLDSLTTNDRSEIGRFFSVMAGGLDALLARTTRLLVQLTDLTSVVVAPQIDDSTLISIDLTALDDSRLLVIFVTRSGRVAKLLVDVADGVAADRLGAVETILGELLVGKVDWLGRHRMPRCDDPEIARVLRAVLDRLADDADTVIDADTDVYLGGAASLAENFDRNEILADVLDALEHRRRLVDLLQSVLASADGSVVVRIGSELPDHDLQSVSMVLAPYQVGGAMGTLGLVGPTRMNYTRAMSAVTYVSEQLEYAAGTADDDPDHPDHEKAP